MQSNAKQSILIIWAILATVAARVFAIAALWLAVPFCQVHFVFGGASSV